MHYRCSNFKCFPRKTNRINCKQQGKPKAIDEGEKKEKGGHNNMLRGMKITEIKGLFFLRLRYF